MKTAKLYVVTNFETNKPCFNGLFSRNNLTAIARTAGVAKDGDYEINFDEYTSIGTH